MTVQEACNTLTEAWPERCWWVREEVNNLKHLPRDRFEIVMIVRGGRHGNWHGPELLPLLNQIRAELSQESCSPAQGIADVTGSGA